MSDELFCQAAVRVSSRRRLSWSDLLTNHRRRIIAGSHPRGDRYGHSISQSSGAVAQRTAAAALCDVDNEEPQETPKSLRGVSRKTVYAMVAADEGRTSERANPRRSRPTLTRSDVVLSGMDRWVLRSPFGLCPAQRAGALIASAWKFSTDFTGRRPATPPGCYSVATANLNRVGGRLNASLPNADWCDRL